MNRNRKKLQALFFLFLIGCIEPFTPDLGDYQKTLVVDGNITNKDGYQYISIGYYSGVGEEKKYVPELRCQVSVLDDKGNIFNFEEYHLGNYKGLIGQEFLTPGRKYRLYFRTQEGKEYESEFDELLACPPIDSLYYEIQERGTYDIDNPEYGIQFYVKTDATGDYADNYLWKHDETWEYHSKYLLEYYYDGNYRKFNGKKDSLFFCWKTETVNEIFTISAKQYTEKKLIVPVRYVSNQTNHLKIGYSLLVKQYSLSDAAYEFWNKVKKQVQESGGLYETQPERILGNIKCISNPEEMVLGFFYASAVQEKRIFVDGKFDFYIYDYPCMPQEADEDAEVFFNFIFSLKKEHFPYWLLKTPTFYDLIDQECVDCRKRGGTLTKPEFWEK
ncbi:MAG: DUF4249 domain-containing protein [Bacteroidales bacterium]|nr:DUF4249 domain-containing protein [Bacteroidales bacterium]